MDTNTLKISEIFTSIEGEGLRTGLPAVFVRTHGCNLRCTYCDSMYAVEGTDFREMDLPQIVSAVQASGLRCVTLTGGEPLIQPGAKALLSLLSAQGYEVNVETNGTLPCGQDLPGVFYTMDWKCGSSGMSAQMTLDHLATLRSADVLKFVVGTESDLEEAAWVTAQLAEAKRGAKMPHIFVSPVYGALSLERIVAWMLGSRPMTEHGARFQVQLHKIIWDPDRRGV